MISRPKLGGVALLVARFLALGACLAALPLAQAARPAPADRTPARKQPPQDDSFSPAPAPDLALQAEGARKADALTRFIEGLQHEEDGDTDKAIIAYEKVLTADPGQVELAMRVAYLLLRQEDYPRAVDVLKDAAKARPKEPALYLQLAFIYARFLHKTEQALKYANQAVTLDPANIDSYQRLYEIYLAAGDSKKALEVLDRALRVESNDPTFWTRLGKLYAAVLLKPDATPPRPEELRPLNEIFRRVAQLAPDDPKMLKEVADYFAASQQPEEAIPLYLKVLELQPDDSAAKEKLATGFLLTNQREKAFQLLEEIIRATPEKYQTYELLARLLEENAHALEKANEREKARADWVKAAANYEQSLLINPRQINLYLRLAQVLLGRVKENERAVRILTEARMRFPQTPEITYFLALALREAKRPQLALTTFEEALHEAQQFGSTITTARFYVDYGATAEQAGLYDKAAELFQRAIQLDPANAEAYNYLGYMWADHNTRLEEAAEMISRALQAEPDNGAYLDSLGWVNYRRGRYEEALSYLLRAAQNIQREDPVVFEHLGDTCFKLNRVPEALDYWHKAIGLDADNKKLAEKIESIQTKLAKGEPIHANQID